MLDAPTLLVGCITKQIRFQMNCINRKNNISLHFDSESILLPIKMNIVQKKAFVEKQN